MSRAPNFDRAETLQRARDLFWRKGFHATSMKDLETALNMRPGSIYAAFRSKENLFIEALDDYAAQSRREVEKLEKTDGSILDALAAFVRHLGDVCDRSLPSPACMMVKTVLETGDETQTIREHAEKLLARSESAFAAAFARAIGCGELKKDADPERLAARFQAEIIGLRTYAHKSNDSNKVRLLAEDIARSIEAMAN